jgi:hypothetical protein
VTGRRVAQTDLYAPMTENDLKQAVLLMARREGWAVYHVPQASIAHKGGGAGYPDLTLARDGEVIWIELKAEKGVLEPQQAKWIAILPASHVIRPSDWYSGRVAELLA